MSFLDDLKKEAAAARARQGAARDDVDEREEVFLNILRPRMRALYTYLRELVEQLPVLPAPTGLAYEVRGFGRLGDLTQGEYELKSDDPENLRKFTFQFVCRGDGKPLEMQQPDKRSYEEQREYLWRCNMRFTSKLSAGERGTIHLERAVPVSLEFEADAEASAIRLRIRNLERLGTISHTFAPRSVDEELMDELARMVLRKRNRFNELSGNTVPDEVRARLRKQIERQQKQRMTEGAGAARPQPQKKKQSILTRPIGRGFLKPKPR